jgi:hypothetical protein
MHILLSGSSMLTAQFGYYLCHLCLRQRVKEHDDDHEQGDSGWYPTHGELHAEKGTIGLESSIRHQTERIEYP